MDLTLKRVYKFSFKSPLDSYNDIYEVRNIITWDDLLLKEYNIYDSVFAGKVTDGDFESIHLPELVQSAYVELYNVKKFTTVYLPIDYIAVRPNPDVKEYLDLSILTNVGIMEDADKLEGIDNRIADIIKGQFGITSSSVITTTSSEWLTREEFDTLQETRETEKTGTVNYYAKVQEQEATITNLQTKIANLEALVVQLNAQANP